MHGASAVERSPEPFCSFSHCLGIGPERALPVELVVRVPREDVNVEMPYVLVTGGLVVLTGRHAGASVRLLESERCATRSSQQRFTESIGQLVQILVVVDWNDE